MNRLSTGVNVPEAQDGSRDVVIKSLVRSPNEAFGDHPVKENALQSEGCFEREYSRTHFFFILHNDKRAPKTETQLQLSLAKVAANFRGTTIHVATLKCLKGYKGGDKC